MTVKKIAIIEPSKKVAENLVQWCQEKEFVVKLFETLEPSSILQEKPDIVLADVRPLDILDIHGDKTEINAGLFDALTRTLLTDPKASSLYVVMIAPKESVFVMVEGVRAGVDSLIEDPADKRLVLERLEEISAKLGFEKKIHLLNLNLVNFFIDRFPSVSREDFFRLAPVVFNSLVINRVRPYIGEATVTMFLQRINAEMGKHVEFMKEMRLQDGVFSMAGVDEASKGVSTLLLCSAFRDYIYAFVHLVKTLTSDILIERWHWSRS